MKKIPEMVFQESKPTSLEGYLINYRFQSLLKQEASKEEIYHGLRIIKNRLLDGNDEQYKKFIDGCIENGVIDANQLDTMIKNLHQREKQKAESA